jgi:hypothetical protein
MRSRDPADAKAANLELTNLFEGRGMKVAATQTNKELLDGNLALFSVLLGMLFALAIMVAVVGGIALMCALSVAWSSVPEIGVLRAWVHARHDRGMFVMESCAGCSVGSSRAALDADQPALAKAWAR